MPRMKDDERRFHEEAIQIQRAGRPIDIDQLAQALGITLKRARYLQRSLPTAAPAPLRAAAPAPEPDEDFERSEREHVDRDVFEVEAAGDSSETHNDDT